MDDFLQGLAIQPEPWTVPQIGVNIGVAFVLGVLISWVYRSTHRQLAVSFSLMNTLVLLAMIMSMVMMVIGNDIARAFGLAGAMSIIRFRTVVKDTRDTAFVFFAIGAGMAAGTGNLKIAVAGTLLISIGAEILHWTRHGAAARRSYLLTFDVAPEQAESGAEVFRGVFDAQLARQSLVSVKSVRMGQFLSLTYQVELQPRATSERLVAELSALEGVHRVTLSFGEEAEN